MTKTTTYQINFTGGIVSPGRLKEVLGVATKTLIKTVRFGLRQQLLLDVPVNAADAFVKSCNEKQITCAPQKEAAPNMLSSYPAASIFNSDTWMREGVYKDIFNQFNYTPKVKINICDSTQNLVPFFTGHINWITASANHFWHLFIRFPKTQTLYCWPEQVYTNDIAVLSKRIESVLLHNLDAFAQSPTTAGSALFAAVKEMGSYSAKFADTPLSLQRFSLPYYEGFNKGESGLWLGLYRRDEEFPVAFLQELCAICTDAKIGQLYTTPWKSLIIKGIPKEDMVKFDWVLGKYRINVRHAANELAWQVEDGDDSGLLIKRHLIRHFDKEDVRTFGLSFGVQSRPTSSMFGSIIIRKQQNKNPHKLKSLERFDLLHTRDFNPNASDLVLFREGLEKEYLGTYLVSLCKMFYEQQEAKLDIAAHPKAVAPTPVATSRILHQCKHCLTIYDEQEGDSTQGIEAGTSFYNLPTSYVCPTCDSGIEDFKTVESSSLQLA
ncbi:Rubredoxin [Cnuella takakiae]|uniref:Rubredoxin n=1 Tax=Cnuella takakiae TaxID=1302690 RepID=A0A1M4YGK0_9BACT|nr:rubredoxin [Cnuella takakiae]OLY93144.1 rubredoxin [Cnuella takakiae]SHF04895.1 Rubredoxin [Cnuella takakiae]